MNAIDVSRYFIEKAKMAKNTAELGRLSPLKLQKILFYAQGWNLANFHKTLFNEKLWAWKYGPVVREVYEAYHCYGSENLANLPTIDTALSSQPTEDERAILDLVWAQYGTEKAADLVDMTHDSDPWLNALDDPFSDEISVESIEKYFTELLG